MRRTRFVEELSQDLGYAARTLRGSPVFTLVAALSLALGIGANTAIFSLVNALLLRHLPVREPARLVALGDTSRTGSLSEGNVRADLFSYPMYREIRDHNQVFTGVLASGRSGRLNVRIAGSPAAAGTGAGAAGGAETARGRIVSGNYFSVLGVRAIRGRTFTAAEDRAPGAAPVVVISHAYWQKRFAGADGAVGRTLTLNGYPFTVIGVAPQGFSGDVVGSPTEIWIPLMMQQQVNPGYPYLDRWDTSWLLLLGRLKPGVPLARAGADVNLVFGHTLSTLGGSKIPPEILPGPRQTQRIEASSGAAGFSYLRRQFSQPLLILMGLVGLVLAVACTNVANLLLERAMGRQKEIAVRLALGAGRGRLIRQLLTESLLLAALGGGLGVLFALWAGPALLRLAGGSSAVPLDLAPDLPVLAFTTLLALATGIAFGLAPARRATRVELAPTLKENARSVVGAAGAGGRWPVAKLLVVGQFALSLLLLVGAGLFVGSLRNLERLDLGYDRDRLALLRLDPVAAGYQGARLDGFPLQILERVKAVPGVIAATYSENGIFSGTESDSGVALEGVQAGPDGLDIHYDRVGPDYFRAVGVPLLAGRDLGAGDRGGTARVAVVNEALAKRYFPGRSPLGRRLTMLGPPNVDYEIVGVAKDVRDHDLHGAVPPRFYIALAQSAGFASAFNLEVRTAEPRALLAPLRATIRAYDPDLPILDAQLLAAMIDDSINHERMIAKLSAVFGLLALLLAAIGLYGVISYTISRRVSEIGIRLALGAQRRDVLWMVLRETLLLALAGVALGVPVALAAARLVASRLSGLSAHDPATLAASTALLLAVALAAGALPGSRASRVDPTQALRYG